MSAKIDFYQTKKMTNFVLISNKKRKVPTPLDDKYALKTIWVPSEKWSYCFYLYKDDTS